MEKPGDRPQGNSSAFLPSAKEEMLLKACLLDGRAAFDAWQAWKAIGCFEEMDSGTRRLLPLLAGNLRRLGIEDPAFETYSAIRQRGWALNHLLLRAAGPLARRLAAANIPLMALKGIVLAQDYYKSLSLRPMADVDLLVRPDDGLAALEILDEMGWRVRPGCFRPRSQVALALAQGCNFQEATNAEIEIDLHWRLLQTRFSPEAEKSLWDRAVPFRLGDSACLAPCAADMLVHICAHGARWSEASPVRWVADAAMVIRSGAVDWGHAFAQIERLGLALPLRETLTYLRTKMDLPVPEMIPPATPPSSAQRALYQFDLKRGSLLDRLRVHRQMAYQAVARFQGPVGYWRYGVAALQMRSVRGWASWCYAKLVRDQAP